MNIRKKKVKINFNKIKLYIVMQKFSVKVQSILNMRVN